MRNLEHSCFVHKGSLPILRVRTKESISCLILSQARVSLFCMEEVRWRHLPALLFYGFTSAAGYFTLGCEKHPVASIGTQFFNFGILLVPIRVWECHRYLTSTRLWFDGDKGRFPLFSIMIVRTFFRICVSTPGADTAIYDSGRGKSRAPIIFGKDERRMV